MTGGSTMLATDVTDVVDSLKRAKETAKAKYRSLICEIAEGVDVEQDELNAAMAPAGFSLADVERHVQIARRRLKAVKDKERADKELNTAAELNKQIEDKRTWCKAEMKRMDKKLEAAHEDIFELQGRVSDIHRRQQDAAKECARMQSKHVQSDLKSRLDVLIRDRTDLLNSVRGLTELRDKLAKKAGDRDQLADAERESSRGRSLDESLSRLNHKAERYDETVEALKEQSARLARIENEIRQTTSEMQKWQNFELNGEEDL